MTITYHTKAALLAAALAACGAGSVRCQNTETATALRPTPMFTSKRADLEIEVAKPGDRQYRIYLVDNGRSRTLPNQEVIPAQRVYQFEDLESGIPPVTCLDDNGNLYVLIEGDRNLSVRRYDPATPIPIAFTEEWVREPESWAAALASINSRYPLPNHLEIFGAERIGRLQKVSDDDLVPEKVKEEQRDKLRRGVVAVLNGQLASMRESLDEVAAVKPSGHTIQEVWVARDVRLARKAGTPATRSTEKYRNELRLLNRIVLEDLLAYERINGGFYSLVKPLWSTELPSPDSDANPNVKAALEAFYAASPDFTIQVTSAGRVEFSKNGFKLPVVLDAETGSLLEPLTTAALRTVDIPVHVGAIYRGILYNPNRYFALRITSYDRAAGSFSGLLYWQSRRSPNRISGTVGGTEVKWTEYRNVAGVEVPGAEYVVQKEQADGNAHVIFRVVDPKIGEIALEGHMDLRPGGKEAPANWTMATDMPSKAEDWTDSPYAGRPLPTGRGALVPDTGALPWYVSRLLDAKRFDAELTVLLVNAHNNRRETHKAQFKPAKIVPKITFDTYMGDVQAVDDWDITVEQIGGDNLEEGTSWSFRDGVFSGIGDPMNVPKKPGPIRGERRISYDELTTMQNSSRVLWRNPVRFSMDIVTE